MKEQPADFTAVVDTREQMPFDLAPMQVEPGTLYTGDYSVKGLEAVIAVERKSMPDLIGSVGRERERFERELLRLRSYPVSAVIIEASWRELERGDWRGKITPNHVLGSLTSWIAQGHTIIVAGDRAMAQRVCRSILFHAAKYRYRESKAFIKGMSDGQAPRECRSFGTPGNVN